MHVSVIVPARDAAATIGATLAALGRQTVACEVIVVDDGSKDATAAIARGAGAQVITVNDEPGRAGVPGGSAGPGAARNAGVAAARGDVLAFTDADCVPEDGWVQAGLAALADADLVQGRVDPDPAARRHPFDRTVSVLGPHGLFETANLIVTRALFARLGGFSDGIVDRDKPLGEDVDFGWRARRAGARTAFAPDALVHHAVFARDWREYVGERARLRHFPAIVRAVPELRTEFLKHKLLLPGDTGRLTLAAGGLLVELGWARGWVRPERGTQGRGGVASGHRRGTRGRGGAASGHGPAGYHRLTRRPRGGAAKHALPVLAAAATLPYMIALRRRVRQWPEQPTLPLAAAYLAGDTVGAAALLYGSVRQRTPVL